MKSTHGAVKPVRIALLMVGLLAALSLRLDAGSTIDGTIDGYVSAPDGPDSSDTISGRVVVIATRPITDGMLAQLADLGKVHGWVRHLRMVAMTPNGNGRKVIRALPFVASIETDTPRYLTDAGSWDRDMLDVVDVEENGSIGDPDAREVAQTGAGVHLALIDTGLISNWRDFLVDSRVDTSLAQSFLGGGAVADNANPSNEFNTSNPTDQWENDTNSHGTATASHIIGFKIGGRVVDGTAPGVTLFPIDVFPNGEAHTWSSRIVAAFDYVTQLKTSGRIGKTVVSMSISGGAPNEIERAAIDRAIAAGVIVVTSAGNRGERGMGWPAANPEVISVGAVGWTRQFQPGTLAAPNFAFWWTRDVGFDPDPASGPAEESEAFVADFSSRAIPSLGQQLDVLAPGQWTVAPGNHGPNAGFFFWSGTSFSTPLTAGIAALLLEKNGALGQADVESILKSTARPMLADDHRDDVLDPILGLNGPISWDTDCGGMACDPVGAGLVQADAALAATP